MKTVNKVPLIHYHRFYLGKYRYAVITIDPNKKATRDLIINIPRIAN